MHRVRMNVRENRLIDPCPVQTRDYERFLSEQEWLFASGVDQAWLTTDAGTRAARFYTAAGWRRVNPDAAGDARFELSPTDWRRGCSST